MENRRESIQDLKALADQFSEGETVLLQDGQTGEIIKKIHGVRGVATFEVVTTRKEDGGKITVLVGPLHIKKV